MRAALAAVGLALPGKRIAVNLAPADLVKEGAHFDLPMSLAVSAINGCGMCMDSHEKAVHIAAVVHAAAA